MQIMGVSNIVGCGCYYDVFELLNTYMYQLVFVCTIGSLRLECYWEDEYS